MSGCDNFASSRVAPQEMILLSQQKIGMGVFLCTRVPRGRLSAEADGCPAREKGKMALPYSIAQAGQWSTIFF
ncbi:hypothetical protein D3Z60_04755 [Lachnospiraceae bacterium]|nr:hypothetical protein [Lachnospiraceae bacterium]